jgi:hypothetical protein
MALYLCLLLDADESSQEADSNGQNYRLYVEALLTPPEALTAPTGSLIVTSHTDLPNRLSVWYTIQLHDSDKTDIKTARFSELHSLHKRLKVEVPSFPGRFPSCRQTYAKTWSRKKSAAFVESRRKDIELYLQLVATHSSSNASQAWLAFIGDVNVIANTKDGKVIGDTSDQHEQLESSGGGETSVTDDIEVDVDQCMIDGEIRVKQHLKVGEVCARKCRWLWRI